MRIALAAEGTRGDIYPMLALAESLAARGHAVRLCAPPDFRSAAEERGVEFRAVGASVRETLRGEAAALTAGGLAMLRAADRYARRPEGKARGHRVRPLWPAGTARESIPPGRGWT